MDNHSYNVEVKWEKGRIGSMHSPELKQSIEVATPPQFPQGVEGVWSPEHLFTAAVGSCLMTTFLAIAENSKLDFTSFSVSSKGILENVEGKFLMTTVELYPRVSIRNEKDRERAERILSKSEAACLISNSVKSEVKMKAEITVESV